MAGKDIVTRRGDLARIVGSSRSTATVGFGASILTWADLPDATRRAARPRGPVLAEQVGLDAGYEQSGDAVTQLLRGWRAPLLGEKLLAAL